MGAPVLCPMCQIAVRRNKWDLAGPVKNTVVYLHSLGSGQPLLPSRAFHSSILFSIFLFQLSHNILWLLRIFSPHCSGGGGTCVFLFLKKPFYTSANIRGPPSMLRHPETFRTKHSLHKFSIRRSVNDETAISDIILQLFYQNIFSLVS